MKLDDWLKAERGRRVRLARTIGKTTQLIDYIARGESRGSPETMAAISTATLGEVSVQELLYPEGLPPGAAMTPSEPIGA